MLSLVITLLIIALIAAVLGFGGIAGAAVGIAKTLSSTSIASSETLRSPCVGRFPELHAKIR
jgi:uncharacterized membrane protein YtjA (UPF0391 family)